MSEAVRVKDRAGNFALRVDGVLVHGDRLEAVADGQGVRVPFMLMDSSKPTPTSAATDAEREREAVAGVHDTMQQLKANAWKSPAHQDWDAAYSDALATSGDPREARIAADKAAFDRSRGAA